MECLPAGSLKNLFRWHFLSICFFLWSLSLFLYTCRPKITAHITIFQDSSKRFLKRFWNLSGTSHYILFLTQQMAGMRRNDEVWLDGITVFFFFSTMALLSGNSVHLPVSSSMLYSTSFGFQKTINSRGHAFCKLLDMLFKDISGYVVPCGMTQLSLRKPLKW